MMKKTIDDVDVRGRRVLLRLDLNVPLDEFQQIADDRRITATLPTVRRLLDGGARLVIISHLGRPAVASGREDRLKLSLAPVAALFDELLGRTVELVNDCVGDAPKAAVDKLGEGGLCMLENLRFHEAETIKDKDANRDPQLRERKDAFARALAALADVYVNDAFGTCHRDNASMVTVPKMMADKPRVIGYLVDRELKFLGDALAGPARPFVCLLGGAKVSDKVGVVRALLSKCESVLVGGAMAYTFLAAEGINVGRSRVEPELFETARGLRREAGDRLRLPVDSVVTAEIKAGAEVEICEGPIPEDRLGGDIGPKTLESFRQTIHQAGTVFWNGPVGVFETPPLDRGTLGLAEAVAAATQRGAVTVVGGGDTAAALDKAGVADQITHISTGGGATLEFLEGRPFPALQVIDDLS